MPFLPQAAGAAGLSHVSAATLSNMSEGAWSRKFDWDSRVLELLDSPFALHEGFRPYQREVINATLSGRDCFCVMRTGGGKSLTYQLPAMLQGGITLVVSPLLSLITDQVDAMNARAPGSAAALTSSTDRSSAAAIHRAFKGSDESTPLRLVYVTPERVSKSKQLLAALEHADKRGALTRFVIDEAHCCSQWGFDFRSDYGQLHVLKKVFPRVPLLALTATAPPSLAEDVQRILLINNRGEECVRIRAPSDRPNIFYECVQKPSSEQASLDALHEWISANGFAGQSGIIYCFSRKDCEDLAAKLRSRMISAAPYHAGLEDAEKSRVHKQWLSGRVPIVCATVAFGLGIDKPNVRYVAHFCIPKSVEAYYQESGRAGRDGLPARVVLFFSPGDSIKMAGMCHTDRSGVTPLRAMQRYAMALQSNRGSECGLSGRARTSCRREYLARALGDSAQDISRLACRGTCDLCLGGGYSGGSSGSGETGSSSSTSAAGSSSGPGVVTDVTDSAKSVMAALREAASKSKKLTFKQLVDDTLKQNKKNAKALKSSGSKPTTGASFNALSSAASCEWLCSAMLLDDIITEDFHYTAYATIVCEYIFL